jgi:ATP-dependent Clp protease ATP-binding subunit ClpC
VFERFTDRARRAIVLAQEEARILNHNYIGTEHVLLGLVHEAEGVAAKVLASHGVDLDNVRSEVEQIIGLGKLAPSGHIPFTPRAKEVLSLALREALTLGHNYIGTEHILLGIIREGEGVASQVLKSLGVTLESVRKDVIKMITEYKATGNATATTVWGTAVSGGGGGSGSLTIPSGPVGGGLKQPSTYDPVKALVRDKLTRLRNERDDLTLRLENVKVSIKSYEAALEKLS